MPVHPLDALFDLVSELEQHTLCADPFDEYQVRTAEMLRNKAINGLVNARSRALTLDLRDKIEFTAYCELLDALCLEAGKLLEFPPGTRYKGDPSLNARLFTQLNAVQHARGKLLDLRGSLPEKTAPQRSAGEAETGEGDGGNGKRGNAEETGANKRSGGKRPLEKSNPLKFQVYQRIQKEHQRGEEYVETVKRLRDDTNFVEQVKDAGLGKLDTKLVRNALAFFDYRNRKARKNQETDPA
jgi:hypothetical protein